MLNKSVIVLLFIYLITASANAQLTDLFRLEYSFIPKSKSQDQYTRLRALFNYPIQIKDSDYLVFGAEYNRVILNLEETYPFETSGLNTIHIIDFNLGYTFKWNKKWRIGFKVNPRVASTLTRSITKDDIFINGGVYFVTDRMDDTSLKHPYRLVLGLTYNATTGLPFPLPFISYTRKINEHWEYNLGVPKSSLKYNINDKHVLLSFIGLDGYLAHLQRPTVVNGQEVDHISLSVVVGGAGYQYFFTKHIMGYMYSGYSFRLNNVLRNDNRDEIYKLDDRNAFYLRTGIKYKF
ncbi:hypothetical protein PW52_12755 [Tamlana sedimentorum]|uniref:DUF6268 domain-containing protein n=1 Tax=Neotamlana sedimentorum TaxID=1435349 RepID=A0A0D7WB35_9FLAO|nr:DUF6268 family outer membrane beta-barrel protein [Tamlana sedimentorum]KJD34967.1 hypothetical protein PW52_12755 [Tamlana sedimentorum]